MFFDAGRIAQKDKTWQTTEPQLSVTFRKGRKAIWHFSVAFYSMIHDEKHGLLESYIGIVSVICSIWPILLPVNTRFLRQKLFFIVLV